MTLRLFFSFFFVTVRVTQAMRLLLCACCVKSLYLNTNFTLFDIKCSHNYKWPADVHRTLNFDSHDHEAPRSRYPSRQAFTTSAIFVDSRLRGGRCVTSKLHGYFTVQLCLHENLCPALIDFKHREWYKDSESSFFLENKG